MITRHFQLGADFPEVSYADWRKAVEGDLKGAPFEKRMISRGYEGIELQPLYTEDIFPTREDPSGVPGHPPFARAASVLGNRLQGWDIRQEPDHPDPAQANAQILDDLAGGGTSVSLRLDAAAWHGLDADAPQAGQWFGRDGVAISTTADLAQVLDKIRLDVAGAWLHAGAAFLPAAALYVATAQANGVTPDRLLGGFNADPLGTLMHDGSLPVPVERALADTADLASWTAANAPRMTAVEVNTSPYHDAGANSVQDLAFLLGSGVAYLRALTDAGLDVSLAARQIQFSISVGARFYQAIAKLRAARVLWAAVVAAAGGTPDAQAMRMRVATGRRVLTTRGQSVNILRNTVAAYAGAIASAEAITTIPFDAPTGISTEQSRRNARNTQIVLAEECHLNHVVDPAGGAWYIEWYTQTFVEQAWALFQQIEAQGGMIAAIANGWVAERIAAVETKRERDIASRKVPITGISEHPSIHELRTPQQVIDRAALRDATARKLAAWRSGHASGTALAALAASQDGRTAAAIAAAQAGATLGEIAAALVPPGSEPAHVSPLVVHPYDEAFEDLRDAAEAFATRKGHPPRVWLAGIGSIAEQTARRNFSRNLFESGGFEVLGHEAATDVEQAAAAFAQSGATVAVICSTDKRYPAVVPELAPKLKAAGARHVILAGNPGAAEAAYREAGVDRFIFVRCDVLETLWSLLRAEEAV
ncbi:Methylmalonyl-CoA mutase [Rhodovastum atsumiense]|uniref:Methylmalonyl-CoA mutase n=1 Tax=Rhodovastum atsumiense TaxID=504468 RepID=A0A5M6IIK4_9PROT|nr:methylmalonyl-CoA mutase family protein [Rhodovastum atsumiense]KAA5608116.1 methylmalonyl-CoA mutase [Rhodovastum atsumiense]CAH2600772.1 Methylmalonyl-CoA mutase [Rhodovastum atsumiense]